MVSSDGEYESVKPIPPLEAVLLVRPPEVRSKRIRMKVTAMNTGTPTMKSQKIFSYHAASSHICNHDGTSMTISLSETYFFFHSFIICTKSPNR